MGRDKFLEALGIVPRTDNLKDARIEVIESEPDGNPPKDKVAKIPVTEAELKKIADKPDSASIPSDSNQEVSRLKSKLLTLEQNGEGVREQLNGINSTISELRGEVKASPAIVQGEQILHTLEEVQIRLNRLEEAFKASACPKCGTLGYGSNIMGLSKSEFSEKAGKPCLFPFDFDRLFLSKLPQYRVCPNPECDQIERVEVEKEEE